MNCLPCERSDIQSSLWTDSARQDVLLGTALRLSTMCLPDSTTHDQISQAFPRHVSYWKQPNTGGEDGLGRRLE